MAGSPRRSARATIVPMGQLLLFVVVALVVAAIVFGVTVMVSGGDSGLTPVEPDGRALPLPTDRPLGEEDLFRTRFDTAFRGYRMAQVDQALQRAAYDIGYKTELIGVLEAEVTALREGRTADADVLRRAREAAVAPPPPPVPAEVAAEAGATLAPGPSKPVKAATEPAEAAAEPVEAASAKPASAGASGPVKAAAEPVKAASEPVKAASDSPGGGAAAAGVDRNGDRKNDREGESVKRTDEEPAERR
ncbi:DivIVA domain-containing protein [Pseudosporangium ferrugineum]|uniref:DivIVA domain-containing protein n=2 Tax=Pseudosporangium ferrugineum TaxID=439699 RepID=A0A2T0S4Y3_9ACTN|nr:DivIVA domain-containing protein [Pseudosporangium ferrugineum]